MLIRLVLIFIISCNIFAEDTKVEVLTKFIDKAKTYIKEHSTEEKEQIWSAEFNKRIKVRTEDSNCDENDAADELVIDWFTVRRNNEFWSDFEVLSICRMFVYYIDKNWILPSKVTPYINSQNYKTLFEKEDVK